MRFLFVHHSFPGQFLHVLRALAAACIHDIVFISRASPGQMEGVYRVDYAVTPASARTHPDARDFDAAMRRAQAVAEVAAGLRTAGFQPDLIVGHEGWGETLNLADVWPATPQIGYREYFYHVAGADVGFDPEFPLSPALHAGVRARNAVSTMALLQQHRGVAPTSWQRSLYPGWAQPGITVLPDGVDLEFCSPSPHKHAAPVRLGPIEVAADDRLVTFAARDLEPYRGFHTFIRALPRLMARHDVRVVCIGGDGASYGVMPPTGTWRARLLAEIDGKIDRERLHFPGHVDYTTFRDVLRRSDIHTYLSYPFIASWSLREALACGCTVLAADTAPTREFIADGETGCLVPALDPVALADRALLLLDRPDRRAELGLAARAWSEANMALATHLANWASLIGSVVHDAGDQSSPAVGSDLNERAAAPQ